MSAREMVAYYHVIICITCCIARQIMWFNDDNNCRILWYLKVSYFRVRGPTVRSAVVQPYFTHLKGVEHLLS